ncbi:hypothetical protein PG993_012607 [Apiospora rasikravindrae]|uniref:Cytochrome P450 n=1 Tax=Apiospora rasikravindrae TaxID=990691 RepID=A0ABR1S314_9PEZI
MSFTLAIVFIISAFATCIWTYRRVLPQPIPGIPYKSSSSKRLLGDLTDVLKCRQQTGEMWSYVRDCALELKSPIFQMFMSGPTGKPWVVIADFWESYDLQMNRQGEFDRSTFLADVFGPLLPGNHVWMPSNETFRAHRRLIRDTMSPDFLNNVAAPAIHTSIQDLLALWREKIRVAPGVPFAADKDIVRGVVDLIMSASLGEQTNLNKTQTEMLSCLDAVDPPADANALADFPVAEEASVYRAVRTLVDSIQIGMSSPLPRHHMNFALRFYPSLAAARRVTDDLMTRVLAKAWAKFSRGQDGGVVSTAADLLMKREAQSATKANREVVYDTRAIRDELFGFYLAGHETTSTTLHWAVKRLSHHPDIQSSLRSALWKAYPRAFEEGRLPTAHEMAYSNVPYLDAFIEENHRLGTTIPTIIRRATRDAVVLGHTIPKGTDVFMIMNGPSFQLPALPVEESKRSASSQETRRRYGQWNAADVETFRPERFLTTDEDGRTRFDPFSGPVLPYGVGLRSCFGIKLAMMELRVILTMVVWSFELQPLAPPMSTFKAVDVNTHRAEQVILKLVEVAY